MNLPTELFDDVIVLHAPDELGAEQSEAFYAQCDYFRPLREGRVYPRPL